MALRGEKGREAAGKGSNRGKRRARCWRPRAGAFGGRDQFLFSISLSFTPPLLTPRPCSLRSPPKHKGLTCCSPAASCKRGMRGEVRWESAGEKGRMRELFSIFGPWRRRTSTRSLTILQPNSLPPARPSTRPPKARNINESTRTNE